VVPLPRVRDRLLYHEGEMRRYRGGGDVFTIIMWWLVGGAVLLLLMSALSGGR
jgi:hypothetical protein